MQPSAVHPPLERIEELAGRAAAPAVRTAIAVLMLWFGVPKLFPGGSPAESLVVRTLGTLSGGLVAGDVARVGVAVFEIGLGVALLVNRCMPVVLSALLVHMAGTAAPLLLFPDETWRSAGIGTLEGQYILKNAVVVAGVVVLAGSMRRGPRGPRGERATT